MSYADVRGEVDLVRTLIACCDQRLEDEGEGLCSGRIGILCQGTISAITSILGCVESAHAFVPFSLSLPVERCKYMLRSANVRIVIADQSFSHLLDEILADVEFKQIKVIVDMSTTTCSLRSRSTPSNVFFFSRNIDPEAISMPLSSVPRPHLDLTDLAYVMFTSGTTGLPKAVGVSHGNIFALVQHLISDKRITGADLAYTTSPPTFDPYIGLIIGCFSTGACMVLPKRSVAQPLHRMVQQHRLTVVDSVPSAFNQIECCEDNVMQSVRVVVVGGEKFPPRLVAKLRLLMPNARIINAYGPTECTVDIISHEIEENRKYGVSVPIGTPHSSGTVVRVVDEQYRLVEAGVIGELIIGGPQVATYQYIADAIQSEDKFILWSAAHDQVASIHYKTGDFGRLDPASGEMEFVGRHDDQVKVNGSRIELHEISRQAELVEGVQHAVALLLNSDDIVLVVAFDNDINEREALTSSCAPSLKSVRRYLSSQLPSFMVPQFMFSHQLPCTIHGKLDMGAVKKIAEELLLEAKSDQMRGMAEFDGSPEWVWRVLVHLGFVSEVQIADFNAPFHHLGLNSVKMFRFQQALTARFPHLPAFALVKYPTCQLLCSFLSVLADQNRVDVELLNASNVVIDIAPLGLENYGDLSEAIDEVFINSGPQVHTGLLRGYVIDHFDTDEFFVVFVKDTFTDYGLVGFISVFVEEGEPRAASIKHFAFACRAGGLMVEATVYREMCHRFGIVKFLCNVSSKEIADYSDISKEDIKSDVVSLGRSQVIRRLAEYMENSKKSRFHFEDVKERGDEWILRHLEERQLQISLFKVQNHDVNNALPELGFFKPGPLNFTRSAFTDEEFCEYFGARKDIEHYFVVVSDVSGHYGLCGYVAAKNNKCDHFVFSHRILGLRVPAILLNTFNWSLKHSDQVSSVLLARVPESACARKVRNWQLTDALVMSKTIIASRTSSSPILLVGHCESQRLSHLMSLPHVFVLFGEHQPFSPLFIHHYATPFPGNLLLWDIFVDSGLVQEQDVRFEVDWRGKTLLVPFYESIKFSTFYRLSYNGEAHYFAFPSQLEQPKLNFLMHGAFHWYWRKEKHEDKLNEFLDIFHPELVAESSETFMDTYFTSLDKLAARYDCRLLLVLGKDDPRPSRSLPRVKATRSSATTFHPTENLKLADIRRLASSLLFELR